MNTSPQDEISPTDESKKNDNLLNLDKSSIKELASSTLKNSDEISQKDAFHRNTFVEPIQKGESSNFTCHFIISTQAKATLEDKSEKGNNPNMILSASSKSSEIAIARDSIDVEKIDNEEDAWKWIVKILEWFKKSLEMEIVNTGLSLVHVITGGEHLMSIYLR